MGDCELLCGCWELNLCPPQEQHILSSAEPPLHPTCDSGAVLHAFPTVVSLLTEEEGGQRLMAGRDGDGKESPPASGGGMAEKVLEVVLRSRRINVTPLGGR